jgi:hypothetical protein
MPRIEAMRVVFVVAGAQTGSKYLQNAELLIPALSCEYFWSCNGRFEPVHARKERGSPSRR